jgi:hypothetical protein
MSLKALLDVYKQDCVRLKAQYNVSTELTFIEIIHMLVFVVTCSLRIFYEGWNFSSGNYLFTTDTK